MKKVIGRGCDTDIEAVKRNEWQHWDVPEWLHLQTCTGTSHTSLAVYVSNSTMYYEFTRDYCLLKEWNIYSWTHETIFW
jgi:hypothetical protein